MKSFFNAARRWFTKSFSVEPGTALWHFQILGKPKSGKKDETLLDDWKFKVEIHL